MNLPTLQAVREWLDVSTTVLSDVELQAVLDAETAIQGQACNVPVGAVDVPDLYQALLRRCARHVAARGVPLGITWNAEFGSARLPSVDSEIERLELPSRAMVIG